MSIETNGKTKLFLDFDGVVVDTIAAVCSLYNEDYAYYRKYKHISSCQVNTWNFDELSCATPSAIDSYFNQPRFFDRIEFMYYAEEVINQLLSKYDITIVSMGYRPNLVGKAIWITKNLPDVHFCGCNFKEHEDKSHIDMSGGILIDDSCKNLISSNADLKICFGDEFPWNEEWNGCRCKNWMDIKNLLLGGEAK